MKFAHLENERTVYDWQGSQVPYLGFDELTHFTEKQFWYMLSRNRSTSGVSGYVRATCNPDAGSWVRKIVDWWIGIDGYPIKDRSGILRWFIRQDDEIIWGDSRNELIEKYGADQQPKSFTFIAASIQDNKILMEKDPSYISNLMALSRVERLRLLGGNWDVKPSAGMYFQRQWFEVLDRINANVIRTVRAWDRAATKPNESNTDPDWTVGIKLAKYHTGIWAVIDMVRMRGTPLEVERCVKNTASQDGVETAIIIEQEPGASGVADADNYIRLLAGYNVRARKPSTDKKTRALPVSAQAEAGNIKVLRAHWNEPFFNETENFTGEDDNGHDDIVDSLSHSFNEMEQGGFSIFDAM